LTGTAGGETIGLSGFRGGMMETREECQEQLKPFLEALEGLKKNGFHGIARIQEVNWPLGSSNAMEIILELKKEILPA
jgi:hypothetical protein